MRITDDDCRRLAMSIMSAGQDAERMLSRSCRALASEATPTGFPSRASGCDSEGGPASVLDDEGRPMPSLSDPTGEAAISDHSRAAADLAELQAAIGWLDHNLGRFVALMRRYGDPGMPAEPPENGGCPMCALHAGVFVPGLQRRKGLCRWHSDHAHASRDETVAYHRYGKRPRKPIDPKRTGGKTNE